MLVVTSILTALGYLSEVWIKTDFVKAFSESLLGGRAYREDGDLDRGVWGGGLQAFIEGFAVWLAGESRRRNKSGPCGLPPWDP